MREHLGREDDARALLRRVFVTPANLRPDLLDCAQIRRFCAHIAGGGAKPARAAAAAAALAGAHLANWWRNGERHD